MKFNELTKSVTRGFHRAGFQIKKHSPEILVVTGVVGTVVGAVMACKATTKVNFVMEEARTKIDVIHEGEKNGEVLGYDDNGEVTTVAYSPEDAKKDLTIVYGQTGLKLVKLYGPAVLVGATSIACILAGHNILHKRNAALAAAYTAVDTGFKKYRKRVVDRFSEQLDKELLYDIKAKEVEETVVDENGNETVVTKTVEVADPIGAGTPYTFCFDETASGWERDAEANKFFLLRQQRYANELLESRGYLYLNDVLGMLGIQSCRAGQAVGWLHADTKGCQGDGYIDFGMLDIYSEPSRRFMNGLEKSIWLKFNVDGDIRSCHAR